MNRSAGIANAAGSWKVSTNPVVVSRVVSRDDWCTVTDEAGALQVVSKIRTDTAIPVEQAAFRPFCGIPDRLPARQVVHVTRYI